MARAGGRGAPRPPFLISRRRLAHLPLSGATHGAVVCQAAGPARLVAVLKGCSHPHPPLRRNSGGGSCPLASPPPYLCSLWHPPLLPPAVFASGATLLQDWEPPREGCIYVATGVDGGWQRTAPPPAAATVRDNAPGQRGNVVVAEGLWRRGVPDEDAVPRLPPQPPPLCPRTQEESVGEGAVGTSRKRSRSSFLYL